MNQLLAFAEHVFVGLLLVSLGVAVDLARGRGRLASTAGMLVALLWSSAPLAMVWAYLPAASSQSLMLWGLPALVVLVLGAALLVWGHRRGRAWPPRAAGGEPGGGHRARRSDPGECGYRASD
jgi:hypothetical protein